MEMADVTYASIVLGWKLDARVQAAVWSLRSPLPVVGSWASSSHVDSVFSSKCVPP